MFSTIKQKYGAVDICVNNAGLGHASTLLTGETSAWKNMFDVRSTPSFILFNLKMRS